EEAVDVGAVGGHGVGDRSRHRAQCRLVEYVVDAAASLVAGGRVGDVAFDETETRPLLRRDQRCHFIQVALEPGGEVIQPDHALVQAQQGFQQVGADEAGTAGQQPVPRSLPQVRKHPRVRPGDHSRPSTSPRGSRPFTSYTTPPLRTSRRTPSDASSRNSRCATVSTTASYPPGSGRSINSSKYSREAPSGSTHGSWMSTCTR